MLTKANFSFRLKNGRFLRKNAFACLLYIINDLLILEKEYVLEVYSFKYLKN